MGEGVAADDQPVAAGKFKRDMALRVAGVAMTCKAGDDVVARLEHFHAVLDRRVIAPRAGDETRALGRQAARRVVAVPEIPFGAAT